MGTTADRGKAYWEQHARRYDRSTSFLSRPVPRMIELTVEAVTGKDDVLELAAGTGLLTTEIARVATHVVATDYAPAMVEQLRVRARDLANVACEVADVYALPYADGSFDAVVAANVLHLLPDLEGALASIKRVLRVGGTFIAPTYLHAETFGAALLSRVLSLTGFPGERRFRNTTLLAGLSTAGFTVTRSEVIPGPFPIGYVEAHA